MHSRPLRLRKNLARTLRGGHPWVFREALDSPPALPEGALVELVGGDGKPLATGFWDGRSPIAVRVLEAGRLPNPEGAVQSRLAAALRRRLEHLDLARTNAFRVVHGEADRLPGIHVDLYDDVAVVRFDGGGARAFYGDLGGKLSVALHPLVLRGAVDRQTGERLWGSLPSGPREVRENGLLFVVSPGKGGKGGHFLDQRENREEVERRAGGRSVLNLFGYTGAFSLYAARGGARGTDTVDVAGPAIAQARQNFKRNGLSLETARFHAVDAFEFLGEQVRKGRTWDLVISDPPSFAPNRSSLPRARAAYTRLHRLAATVTARGGLLCAGSCSSHMGRSDFLASLKAGARAAGRHFALEAIRGAGMDHPVIPAFPEGDYLKFALGRVD